MSLPFSLYQIFAKKQSTPLTMRARFAAVGLLTGVFLLLGMAGAQATTYYVSNGGSDSNSGTSTSAPWKTCAKVNGFTFQPGDLVLFQRGGIWYEALNPAGGDGAAGNPITFADYGSGNKPHLSGGQTLTNAGFSLVSGTVWQYSIATQVNAVYVNKVALIPANPNANQPVSGIPNSFYWNNGVLQINVSTNPNTDGNLYEGAVREDLICNGNPPTFNFHNHLVFTNFVEEESGDLNAGYGVRIQNGTDVVLNNIESYRCGKHNFGIINSTQVTVNGCYAAYPMPGQQPYGGYSAYVSYGDNSTGLSNQTSVYNNCVGDHMEDTQSGQYVDTGYEFFTTHGANVGSVTLNNCQALSSSAGGPGAHWTLNNSDSAQAGHAATLAIHGGILQNNQLVVQGTGLLVDGLTMMGPGGHSTNDATATIDMECSNSTIQNVLMEGLNIGYWLYQAAIQDNGNNNTIRFNTIVNDPSSYDASILNNNTTESLYGNIFINPGNALQGKPPALNQYNLTYASVSGAGFVSPGTGNYGLASGSPAIDEVPLSLAYPSTDIAGAHRPDGSANDAGAYQYGSGGGQQPPSITSATTATGTVGQSFTYQITASNGPTSFAETGTLPAGVSFTASTGVISGTPTATGTFPVTIKATNGAGTGSATLTITVSNPAAPAITSATTATGTISQPFTYQITATGNPTSYGESGTLPAGVVFTASSGVISGTPTATGSFPVTISATNAGGTGSATLTITVNPPGAGNGTGLLGEYFNDPSDGSTQFTDLVLTRVDPTVNFTLATGQSPDPSVNSAFFSVKWVGQVQPLYTDSYQFHVTSDDGARLYINGTKVVESWGPHAPQDDFGVISLTGGQKYTIELDYYQLGYGAQAKLEWQGNSGQQARQVIPASQLYPAAPPPVISSATAVSATVGTAFSYTITAANGPTSYGVTGTLPAGLSFNASSGVISGTPSASGASTVVISATNANGTGSKHLTITVNNPPAPVISSAATASGTVGSAFSYQITASSNPTSYGASGLPAGLSVNTTTGLISGTPSAAGTSSVTISATNAGGTGSKTLTLTVSNPPAPAVTSASASGAVNQAFSYQVQATNNPTSYSATGLPAGLSISAATGLISGTPSVAGTFPVTVKATNAGGSGTGTITITINANHLSGSLGTPPSSVNLTTEGTIDWAHWGSDGSGSWDHKVVNGNTVNAITGWSSRPTVFTYPNNAISYLWTDGQNWNGQAQTTGFYFDGGPFQFTAIADTTVRTMKVYLGSFGGHGQITAHLSDGSSPDYVDSSLTVNANGVYTITYSAASAGQTLTISWTATDGGRLNIQSASLH